LYFGFLNRLGNQLTGTGKIYTQTINYVTNSLQLTSRNNETG